MYMTIEISEKQLKEYLTTGYRMEGIQLTIWEGERVNDCTPEEAKEFYEKGNLPPTKYEQKNNPLQFKIIKITNELS